MRERVLGTPDEEEWPGVTSFPDFKPSFPKWSRQHVASIVPAMNDLALDLLDQLLVYDPAGRISAKQSCLHPYFEGGSKLYSSRAIGQNGFR
jgi:cyclin-dependent kinase